MPSATAKVNHEPQHKHRLSLPHPLLHGVLVYPLAQSLLLPCIAVLNLSTIARSCRVYSRYEACVSRVEHPEEEKARTLKVSQNLTHPWVDVDK